MATRFVLKRSFPGDSAEGDSPLGEYVFDGAMFTVGSDEANNCVLAGSAPEQAVVVREGDHLTLINGADGTSLNGQNLRREAIQPLADGDEIRVAGYVISVVDAENNYSLETTRLEMPSTNGNFAENTASTENIAPLPPAPPETASQTSHPPVPAKPSSNFAAVLDTLRTEEDSFYFIIGDAAGKEVGRLPLEQPATPIGVAAGGGLAFNIQEISNVYAIARKDWSGILIESQRKNSVFVNDEAVETTRRLRNSDRVSFAAPVQSSLVLHEPSLLVALEPLLSARNGSNVNSAAIAQTTSATIAAKPKAPLLERNYFGYFSFVELVTMIIGTLIGAVIFFLFFEFMFA